MTMQVRKSPEVMEKREAIDMLTNEQVKLEITKMAKRINRDPNIKYSITKSVNDSWYLAKEVAAKGRDGVFDSKGKLLKEYKSKEIEKDIANFIFNLANKTDKNGRLLIHPEIEKRQTAVLEHYMEQMVGKRQRGNVFETIPIELAKELATKYDWEVVVTEVTEGGAPDFHIRKNGVDIRIEQKYFKHQQSRTDISEINFATGELTFTKNRTYEKELLEMVELAKPHLKKYNDFVIAEMAKLGITNANGSPITFITNKTKIPVEVFESAGQSTKLNPFGLGLQAKVQQTRSMTTDVIHENYLSKTEPVGLMNIMSTAKKKLGLYYLGDVNTFGFNVPRLEGNVNMVF